MKTIGRIFLIFGLVGVIVGFGRVERVSAATIDVPCGDVAALVAAIHEANSTPEPDVIQLAVGCKYILDEVDNTSDEFGPNGLPVITTKIAIRGKARLERAQEAEPFRFFLIAPTGRLILEGIVLRRGLTAMKAPEIAYSGGAIYVNGGRAQILGSRLKQNEIHQHGAGYGGGVYNAGGNVQWINSKGIANRGNSGGGAIYSDGDLSVGKSKFIRNTGGDGGAILNRQAARVYESMFLDNDGATGTLDVRRFVQGAAIYNQGVMNITESGFFRNRNRGAGGGIFNVGVLGIQSSTISFNRARHNGGAISNHGSLRIANSTVNNNASRDGGGIYNEANVEMLNVTVAKNLAQGEGGNLYTSDGATSIVANTILALGNPQNCRGGLIVQGGNLRFPDSDLTCEGEHGDPKLGALSYNGGLTPTMALGEGSRAINKGLRENCDREPVNNHDQRGVGRLKGDEPRCDSGAYEVE